jgi:1-acyl-sn-glycerol-3-phosphate acyltransferase
VRIGAWVARLALLAFHTGFVRPMLKLYWGARFRKANLIPSGPCLVVGNHNSHIDAALLMTLFPLGRLHRVHPVAAADYFGESWFRRTMAMVLMNGIPIARRPTPGQDPLAPMIRALERGDVLILFPEGSRGEPGVVAPFRSGVGRLARAVPGLPIVPVFMSGPERTWPRGENLPLPLGIDVEVGRPRTYDPSMDPKEIAEKVREDLLALAPPPLPMPGPRPSPPIRVAVCGIDDEANRKVFEALTRRLGPIGRTVGLDRTILESDEAGMREAGGRVPLVRSTLSAHILARVFRTGGLFRGDRFASMVAAARVDEALSDGRTARFVVSRGNALVDLLAWAEADFYRGVFDDKGLQQLTHYLSGQRKIPIRLWWEYARKAPEVWLLNTFDLAHPPVPDVVVLLTRPGASALEGMRARGEDLDPYPTAEWLERLQEAYRQVSGVLRKPGAVEVIVCDAEHPDPELAADRAEQAVRRLALVQGQAAARAE